MYNVFISTRAGRTPVRHEEDIPMANEEITDPDFSSEQEGAIDLTAQGIIAQQGVETEVVAGESDATPDAIDNEGNGWVVVEVIARIKRCKP